ncbi:MAG TPA: lipocalin-like domain-containing protein [Terriglobales bacterium]
MAATSRLIVLCACVFTASIVLLAQTPAPPKPVHTSKETKATHPEFKPFIGTWKLVSSIERHPDGTEKPYGFGPHAAGYLMYDATGHVCAQVANLDRPKWADPDNPKPGEVKTAFDGFGGYCGTYKVDPAAGTAAHVPEVGFDPNEVGQPKPRKYRFEQGRLIYSGTEKRPDGEVVWTMTWERVE